VVSSFQNCQQALHVACFSFSSSTLHETYHVTRGTAKWVPSEAVKVLQDWHATDFADRRFGRPFWIRRLRHKRMRFMNLLFSSE
jgi:hypothetical protein